MRNSDKDGDDEEGTPSKTAKTKDAYVFVSIRKHLLISAVSLPPLLRFVRRLESKYSSSFVRIRTDVSQCHQGIGVVRVWVLAFVVVRRRSLSSPRLSVSGFESRSVTIRKDQ